MSEEKEFSIEAAMKRLEEITGLLEDADTSLADSMKYYSEGVKLVKECKDSLTEVEKEMIILNGDNENNEDSGDSGDSFSNEWGVDLSLF